MSAIDRALINNAVHASGHPVQVLMAAPAQRLAVVTCIDARIPVPAMLGLEDGDAHILRNAGGVITEDVIRSLVISQRLLGTREIMLIHHTDCGMLSFRDDELKDQIERDTGIRPPFAMEAFTSLEDDVRRSIARLLASPFIPWKDGVRGFVYDIGTGKLSEVRG